MITLQDISNASQGATSYPQLAQRYIDLGVLSYTVDVASDVVCYRLSAGQTLIRYADHPPRTIANAFNKQVVIQTIQDNIDGKITYPQFMDGIAAAGVRFYEATLNGNNKRVTYIGLTDAHDEPIPLKS